jgi:hypothetical protein
LTLRPAKRIMLNVSTRSFRSGHINRPGVND